MACLVASGHTLFFFFERAWAKYTIKSQKRAGRPLVFPFVVAPELWAEYCGGMSIGDKSQTYSYSKRELAQGWENYLDIKGGEGAALASLGGEGGMMVECEGRIFHKEKSTRRGEWSVLGDFI